MEFNSFVYSLAWIFVPGIFSRIILNQLLFYKKDSLFYFLIHSFLLGVFSYTLLGFVQAVIIFFRTCKFDFTIAIFNLYKNNELTPLEGNVILYASLCAIPVSFLISFFIKNKYLTKISQHCNITSRFAEPDVWSFFLNSDSLSKYPWITVRNKKNNLMYQGCVEAFSDTYTDAELLLSQVNIYENSSGKILYKTESLYITIEKNEIEIEIHQPVSLEENSSQNNIKSKQRGTKKWKKNAKKTS